MVRAGGDAEVAAEPWLEPGAAELLYNQVTTESEFLGTPGASRSPVIARAGFVAVMMRRRLDVDELLRRAPSRHPEPLRPGTGVPRVSFAVVAPPAEADLRDALPVGERQLVRRAQRRVNWFFS